MDKRILSLLLALLLALGAAYSVAETAPVATPEATAAPAQDVADPVLASVAGENVLKSEADAVIPTFLENGYIADSSDYRTVVMALTQNRVLRRKVEEMGFNSFTQEELDAFTAEAQTMWQEYVNSYADYYQSEDTEEARQAAVAQVEAELAASGMTVEGVAGEIRQDAAQDRMNEYMLAGYAPTEEEIAATFAQYGESYRQQYEADVGAYEFNVLYSGEESWYTPEGYRGVIHILLKPDEDLLANYQSLSAAFEEQQAAAQAETTQPGQTEATAVPEASAEPSAEPTATPAPVTAEQLEAARQAVLASRQADVDAIYARLAAGEDFSALVREYGEDPGMGDENNLRDGYQVHAQSILYDPVFTGAAYSDKMQKPGDVSDPVVGTYGIHILKYLRDVPSGLILTDAIKTEITEFLTAKKLNETYTAAFPAWMEQAGLVLYEEAIAQATAQAQENAVSAEEIAPEALPEATNAPAAPEATAAP